MQSLGYKLISGKLFFIFDKKGKYRNWK